MKSSDSTPCTKNDATTWQQCGPCAWAKSGGPPCYYHNSKFGIGKLTTIILHTAEVVAEELNGAVDDELKAWP